MTAGPGLDLKDGDDAVLIERSLDQVSRGELKRQADALFAMLTEHGVGRALVCSDDPLHILRAIDACSRAGADLYIAHTNLPAAQVEEILDSFKIQLRIGETDELRQAPAGKAETSARIFMMTSGTTGRPKIAKHDLKSLLARVKAGAKFPSGRGSKWLLTYQPTGFAGIQVILTAVVTRSVVVAPEHRNPAGFYEAARRAGVTQISATPTFWRSFLMVVQPGELALRQITLGGEAADQSTLDRIKRAFPDARVTHIYASTEAGVVFAVNDGRAGFPAAWLGQTVQGVQLRLEDGYLQIKTPNAMQGYVTETSQPLLTDGWLSTADLCEVVGDRVFVLGRQDSTINVGGSKVYPLAVETFLLKQEGVAEARVYGVANPISGYLVGADVVLTKEADRDTARARILAACRAGLAGYQVPRVFKIVDAIETNASGKKG